MSCQLVVASVKGQRFEGALANNMARKDVFVIVIVSGHQVPAMRCRLLNGTKEIRGT